jgi:hypothetical protein
MRQAQLSHPAAATGLFRVQEVDGHRAWIAHASQDSARLLTLHRRALSLEEAAAPFSLVMWCAWLKVSARSRCAFARATGTTRCL